MMAEATVVLCKKDCAKVSGGVLMQVGAGGIVMLAQPTACRPAQSNQAKVTSKHDTRRYQMPHADRTPARTRVASRSQDRWGRGNGGTGSTRGGGSGGCSIAGEWEGAVERLLT